MSRCYMITTASRVPKHLKTIAENGCPAVQVDGFPAISAALWPLFNGFCAAGAR
jgi:hypothetical protein